jgi:hypothetical protein
MDRTMINDKLNLLHITVTYGGPAPPSGWVRVSRQGNSDLRLQRQLPEWFTQYLPEDAQARDHHCRPRISFDLLGDSD